MAIGQVEGQPILANFYQKLLEKGVDTDSTPSAMRYAIFMDKELQEAFDGLKGRITHCHPGDDRLTQTVFSLVYEKELRLQGKIINPEAQGLLLYSYIENGNIYLAEKLFHGKTEEKKNQLLFSRDTRNLTPLHWCVVHRCIAMSKLLLSQTTLKQALLMSREDNGWNPFHCAVQDGQLEHARQLLAEAGDVSGNLLRMTDRKGRTTLHWAASNGDKAMAVFLLETSRRLKVRLIDLVDQKLQSPLHKVAKRNDQAMVDTLLEGEDIVNKYKLLKAVDRDGRTPLMCAEEKRYAALQKTLGHLQKELKDMKRDMRNIFL